MILEKAWTNVRQNIEQILIFGSKVNSHILIDKRFKQINKKRGIESFYDIKIVSNILGYGPTHLPSLDP